jgi:hypothetical protein
MTDNTAVGKAVTDNTAVGKAVTEQPATKELGPTGLTPGNEYIITSAPIIIGALIVGKRLIALMMQTLANAFTAFKQLSQIVLSERETILKVAELISEVKATADSGKQQQPQQQQQQQKQP